MAWKIFGSIATGIGSVGKGIGAALGSLGTAVKGISWKGIVKVGSVGGIFAGIYAGLNNGIQSAFDGGNSIIKTVFEAAGVTLSDSQANFVLVGGIVIVIVGGVYYFFVWRKK